MKLAVLATMAAIGVAALALPSQAAPLGVAQAGVTASSSHAITQIRCVWHSKRVWVPRHGGHRGHWVRHRTKVCN